MKILQNAQVPIRGNVAKSASLVSPSKESEPETPALFVAPEREEIRGDIPPVGPCDERRQIGVIRIKRHLVKRRRNRLQVAHPSKTWIRRMRRLLEKQPAGHSRGCRSQDDEKTRPNPRHAHTCLLRDSLGEVMSGAQILSNFSRSAQ